MSENEVPTPAVPETPQEAAPQTFTQEDVNRINAADRRKDRERIAELEALVPKAEELDRIKAEQMTALERAEQEKQELAAKLADFEAREQAAAQLKERQDVAVSVAKELGYPSADKALSLAKFLDGDDLTAAAKSIFEEFRPADPAVPSAVHDHMNEAKDDPLRKAFLGLK